MRLTIQGETTEHRHATGRSPQMWGMVYFGQRPCGLKDELTDKWRGRSDVQWAAGDDWCLVRENGGADGDSLASNTASGLHAAVVGDVWPLHDAGERNAPLIASLYHTHRDSVINQCDGQFAAAVIDEGSRRAVLTVNWPGGFHWLYYCTDGRALAFATRLDLLVHRCGWQARASEQAVVELLRFGGLVAEKSLLEGVSRVIPGHIVVFENGHARQSLAYECPPCHNGEPGDMSEFARLHRQAMQRRIAGHDDFGLFLSGGLDSGVNVAVAAELCGKPVKTFSAAFDVAEFDESSYARLVATRYRTEHSEVRLSTAKCLDRLPEMVWAMQDPIIDYSYIPTFLVADAIRKHVGVAIGGDGPDHFLGRNYQYATWYDLLHRIPLASGAAAWLVNVSEDGGGLRRGLWQYARRRRLGRQLWQSFACARMPCGSGMLSGFRTDLWGDLAPNDLTRVLSPDLRRRVDISPGDQKWFEGWSRDLSYGSLNNFILADASLSGLCGVFAKVGAMCSAHGLTIHEPYLAGPLIRWLWGLQDSWKVHGSWPKRLTRTIPTQETKRILRRMATRYLPEEIIAQKQKHGFEFPLVKYWQESTSGVHARQIFGGLLGSTDWFDPIYLERLVQEQASGARNHRYMLLLFAALDQWFRIFIQGRAEAPTWRWSECF